MRILIQHQETRQYVGGSLWTDDPSKATEFSTAAEADEFCSRHNLQEAAVVFKFKDSENDTRFIAGPVSKARILRTEIAKPPASPVPKPGLIGRFVEWARRRIFAGK